MVLGFFIAQETRRIQVSDVASLPRSIILSHALWPWITDKFKIVRDSGQEFVVCDPLILFPDPFWLVVFSSAAGRSRVKLTKQFCGPTEVNDTTQDPALSKPQVEAIPAVLEGVGP